MFLVYPAVYLTQSNLDSLHLYLRACDRLPLPCHIQMIRLQGCVEHEPPERGQTGGLPGPNNKASLCCLRTCVLPLFNLICEGGGRHLGPAHWLCVTAPTALTTLLN